MGSEMCIRDSDRWGWSGWGAAGGSHSVALDELGTESEAGADGKTVATALVLELVEELRELGVAGGDLVERCKDCTCFLEEVLGRSEYGIGPEGELAGTLAHFFFFLTAPFFSDRFSDV